MLGFHVWLPLCPEKGAAEQVVISGILPILALSLRSRGPLTLLTARLVAELAKECKLFKQLLIFICFFFLLLEEISHVLEPDAFDSLRSFPVFVVVFFSAVVRKGFGDAGLVTALLSVLTSPDQELLLHAALAISRMSYDSCKWGETTLKYFLSSSSSCC